MTNTMDAGIQPVSARLTALRDEIPLLHDVAFFQTGSLAPLATAVRTAIVETVDAEGVSGLYGAEAIRMHYGRNGEYRARLADFVGVSPAELGWTINTTTSIRFAMSSLVWQPGDRLLTTNHEHISTRSLQTGLQHRFGVETIVANAGNGPDRLLSELAHALETEPSIRLLLISHVSCQDGRRLPVEEVIRLAHDRGVPVLVDGAQSLGQFPINVHELGCDMLVGSAHKWLLGPAGLGFLYVAAGGLSRFRSEFVMAPDDAGDIPATTNGQVRPLASRMEIGTQGMSGPAGLAAALELIDPIGLAAIENHVRALTARLHAGLRSLAHITIVSPTAPEQQSGITSFTISEHDMERYQQMVASLWETERVVAKVQGERPSIRVSIAAFNNADDVDRLIHGLASWLRS